jgi:hypothetical protein
LDETAEGCDGIGFSSPDVEDAKAGLGATVAPTVDTTPVTSIMLMTYGTHRSLDSRPIRLASISALPRITARDRRRGFTDAPDGHPFAEMAPGRPCGPADMPVHAGTADLDRTLADAAAAHGVNDPRTSRSVCR